jgi:aromatic ring-opening dioxygenase catalytic subunit (LigB family)
VPLYYDFGGGPKAARPGRGLDHGAFIPLMLMYPDADIPVLEIFMPTPDPAALTALGQQLSPLRQESPCAGLRRHRRRPGIRPARRYGV